MKTNTELLMNALGWQGGTVHQVARETGLSVLEILDLDKYYPADGDNRSAAYMFVGQVRAGQGFKRGLLLTNEHSQRISGDDFTGYDNVMYWRGVLATMQQKESDLL